MELPFEQDALDEFEAAAKYIDAECEGHGLLFIDEVKARVARAARFPRSGVAIPGIDAERDVRRFGLERFPYSVIIGTVSGRRAVLAVAHMSREPGYWRDRLK
ncbi:MAG: type II toxin-antitoxin system RelE/ParE family toxin [Sandaracinaceae bacterium]|nr:type II toxin-antitoxin system RelE/ParE family toxin [Sandaracinaceae bacterium]